MGFADKKGITVASGFKLQAQMPIDARFVVDTITERDELVSMKAAYEGLDVFVKETGKKYMWDGEKWEENTTGAAYKHPTTPGNKHIPAGGTKGQVLKNKANGEAEWADERTYNKASEAADGLMSKEDYAKLKGVAAGAQVNVIEEIRVKGQKVEPSEKAVNLEVLVAKDLADYKKEVDQQISTIPKFAIAVVEELPVSDISGTTVYLLKSGAEEQNLYTEYIYTNEKWEKLGTQTVDLSDYVRKADALSGAKAKDEKTIVFTRANGTTFEVIITGVTYQHPESHPASMITQDATHRFTTDAEKKAWNEKANIYFGSDLPEKAPAGAVCFLIS